jgi:hypothetical protein
MVWLTHVEYSKLVEQVVLFGPVAVAIYAFARLVKKVGIEPSQVIITGDDLQVVNTRTGEHKLAQFKDVVSYRYQSYRGGKELRLKLKDTQHLRLSANSENFDPMVREFELALSVYQHREIEAPAQVNAIDAFDSSGPVASNRSSPMSVTPSSVSLRETPFFEKPVATVLLVLYGGVLAVFTGIVAIGDKPVPGGLFTGYAGFLTYGGAWHAARAKRRS